MDKKISLNIPENLLKSIDRLLKKKDVSRSVFIRNALREAVRLERLEGKNCN